MRGGARRTVCRSDGRTMRKFGTLLVLFTIIPALSGFVAAPGISAPLNLGPRFPCAAHMSADGPSARLSPIQVVEGQLAALQRGDVQTCFKFASPNNKRATGPWQRFEIMIRQTPAYAPPRR